jgi:hypothetical protein
MASWGGRKVAAALRGQIAPAARRLLLPPHPCPAAITMEYGPPSYQPTLPHTGGRPAADIEAVNAWTAGRVRGLYQQALQRLAAA